MRQSRGGLHVFEVPDAELFAYEGEIAGFMVVKGALQHIAFALPDEAAALVIRERLQQHGIWMTGINTLGAIRNFLFKDNNGLILEAAWSPSV